MKYTKSFMRELVYEGENDSAKVIEDEIFDNSRWSIIHGVIFYDDMNGKYFATSYSVGATEQQDEQPYEYEPDMIECEEVFPVVIEKTIYLTAKQMEKQI